jgi:hypothetical protein
MKRVQATRAARVIIPSILLCLSTAALSADETYSGSSIIANETLSLISQSDRQESNPNAFPVMLRADGGLDFDLGESDSRKLQLQLEQPISLHAGTMARIQENGANMLGLDATLNAPVTDHFSLTAGVDQRIGVTQFQPVGSIHCMNGILRADSYTAFGCRFVTEPTATTEQQRISLGARMDFSNASASINLFGLDSSLDQVPGRSFSPVAGRAAMGAGLLSPNLVNPMLATPATDPLSYLNSEATGVDLNFKVGIATDNQGDLQLGLAFSRVLEANYDGLYSYGPEPLAWTVAEPFNTASMNLEWRRGSISSGIQGFYRESVDFLNRKSLDSLTTFDVHFTWRTPWNANLSVGAANVLNAGTEGTTGAEPQPVDPLESIYGRIPYVRYKQDL